MENIPRREFLQMGSLASLGTLSGCSFFRSDNSMISLEILNTNTSPHSVSLEFLRMSENGELSELSEYNIEVEGKDAQGAGTTVRKELLPTNSYIVRVDIEENTLNDHYHFHPRCDGRSEYFRISLLTNQGSLDSVGFHQSCS